MENVRAEKRGFQASVRAGVQIVGNVAHAPIGFPKSEYGAVLGNAAVSEGIVTFGFKVQSNATTIRASQIAVGIADANVPLTSKKTGIAIGLHIGRGKVVTAHNGHVVRRGGRKLSPETPRSLPADASGRINIMVTCNMDTRRIGVAINENRPIDAGYLPEAVRPWVWLGSMGAGSVVLSEFFHEAPPPPASLSLGPRTDLLEKTKTHARPDADATTGPTTSPAPEPPVAGVLITSASPAREAPVAALLVTTLASEHAAEVVSRPPRPLAAKAAAAEEESTPTEEESVPTERASESADSTSIGDASEWTVRASAWLQPLQRFFNHETPAMSPEEAATLEA